MGNFWPTQKGKVLDKPWRTFKDNNVWSDEFRAKLIEKIKLFKTYGKLEYAKIQLLGPIKAGKSSFISSAASIDKERIAMTTLAGAAESSFTTRMEQYIFKDNLKGPFRLVDAMGIEEVDRQGFHVDDVVFLMKGHIKPTYTFKTTKPIDPKSDPEYIKQPTLKDMPQCSVITVDSTLIHTGCISTALRDRLDELRTRIQEERVPVVVLLTKIDIICEREAIDITNIYKHSTIRDLVASAHAIFGVPENQIFPVQNYRTETDLDCKMDILLLLALQKMLHIANDRLEHIEDQTR